MSKLLLVCAGGAIGSGARYLVGSWAVTAWGTGFPWGTLVVNLTGSFLISVIMYLGLEVGAVGPDLRMFLAVGVMGGFTTYSSFNHETLVLAQRGQWGLAAGYVGATLLGAWVAGLAGLLLAQFVASGA
ncbi:MAG: camphor resistance protein CrcB [Anaeromyxobacteraceae bacterium]|nr:camphor resistance protein CrcB [Anaeromyxobacteraceae bacterium]